jgi:excisionase family DNA binding protein
MSQKSRSKYRRLKPNTKRISPDRATLSPVESTQITGFGVTRTYQMLHSGEMPCIKVGSRFYIPRAALLQWLATAGGKVA